MIRITLKSEGARTVVAIAGHLVDADVEEVRKVRDSVRGAVALNLRGMDTCAAGGMRLLRAWLDAGAKLQDANPFVAMSLEAVAHPGARLEQEASRTPPTAPLPK